MQAVNTPGLHIMNNVSVLQLLYYMYTVASLKTVKINNKLVQKVCRFCFTYFSYVQMALLYCIIILTKKVGFPDIRFEDTDTIPHIETIT